MAEFRLTFGVQYAREPHPVNEIAHPDGWVTIIADDYEDARWLAFREFGRCWSGLYTLDDFVRNVDPLTGRPYAHPVPVDQLYPLGELARFTADGSHG